MLSLPLVGGQDFIAALERLGFRAASRGAGATTMLRQLNAVVVPEAATLSPVLVGALLRAAHVDPLDFIRALDGAFRTARAPSSRRAPTAQADTVSK